MIIIDIRHVQEVVVEMPDYSPRHAHAIFRIFLRGGEGDERQGHAQVAACHHYQCQCLQNEMVISVREKYTCSLFIIFRRCVLQ